MQDDNSKMPDKETILNRPAEKRQYPRYPTDLPVRFRLINRTDLSKSEQVYHSGKIKDMSLLGMRIETDIRIRVKQELEIFVEDKLISESFFGTVETVRFLDKKRTHEVGVIFIEKNPL